MPVDPPDPLPSHPQGLPASGPPDNKEVELDFDSASPMAPEPLRTRLERRQPQKRDLPPPVVHENPVLRNTVTPSAAPPTPGVSARLERKLGDGTKPFTRFVTRPETTVAADLATDRLPPERDTSGASQSFGKLREQQDLEFRPSRLQAVMDEALTHSRLSWIDHLGRVRSLVIALLVAGVVSIILWSYIKEVLRKRETWTAPVIASAPLPPDAVRQANIRRAFDAYLSARNPADKLRWILEPKRVEPRMKDFNEVRLEKDPAIESYEVSDPIRAGGEWWFTLECRLRGGGRTSVIMKETPEGGQLDWENFTAYGSMAWERFHTSRPAAPQSMRVHLRRSEQSSPNYPPEEFLALEIRHRDGPPVLVAYAARNSRSGQWLDDEPGLNEWKPVNLYLHWETAEGAPPSVVVGDLIRNNWLDAINAAPLESAAPSSHGVAPAKSAHGVLHSLKP